MNIAIIEPDHGQREIYKDILDCDCDMFDDPIKFREVDTGLYNVVFIAHRLGDDTWEKVYSNLKGRPMVIVTATFDEDYYKKEFPNSLYPLIAKIKNKKNVVFHQKNDFKNILRTIEIENLALLPLID